MPNKVTGANSRPASQQVRVLPVGGALSVGVLHAARLRRAGRGVKPGFVLALAGAHLNFLQLPGRGKMRNSKSEIRNPKEIRNPNGGRASIRWATAI
jgi:hypothetical protein